MSHRYVHEINIASALTVALVLAIGTPGQSLAGSPAKIEVTAESPAVIAGSTAQLRVNLVDPSNQPAAAKKDLTIQLRSRLPSGNTESFAVTIKAGEKSSTIDVPAKEPGLMKVIASNQQMASGGSILNVRTKQEMRQTSRKPSETAFPEKS